MPVSYVYQCLGCRAAITGADRVSEFVERRRIDIGAEIHVLAFRQFTHEGHEELAKPTGYVPTGRVGALDDLRSSPPPKVEVTGR